MVLQPGLGMRLSSWRSTCPHWWHQYLILLRHTGSLHPAAKHECMFELENAHCVKMRVQIDGQGLPVWGCRAMRSAVPHDCDHSAHAHHGGHTTD